MKLFELFAELTLNSTGFSSGIKKASQMGGNLASSLKSGIGGAASFVGNKISATTVMLGNLMAEAVKTGTGYVKDFAGIGLDYNNTMETYVTNFTTMLGGSSEAAQKLTGDLEDMAASTPFAMSDLADATQTLLSFGQDSSTVLETLQDLGDISMGDANKLQSLTLAFAQAASSGKLMGQDLMQMINAGFNPLQTIVDKTGVSMGDLKDFMSNGKASSDLKKQMKAAQKEVREMGDQASDGAKLLAMMAEEGVISAETLGMIFELETSPGGRYYNAMQAASETFSGMLSTLQDDSAALLGKVFKPLSNWLKDDLMPKAQDFIATVSKGYDVGGLAGAWSAATGRLSTILSDLGASALTVGSDLLANILTGLTGDEVTGTEIQAFFTNIWTDVTSGIDGIVSAGGGILKGIYDGLVDDGDDKTNIIQELSGLWDDATSKLGAFTSAAGGLLGTIYTGITGEEATATNIGNKIADIFKVGGGAMSDLLTGATSFFTDLSEKLGDPDTTTGEKIAGVFETGHTAMANLLNGAGHFLSDLYSSITGDTAGAAKMESFWDSVFATPDEWGTRLETLGTLPEYVVQRRDELLADAEKSDLRDMMGTLLASGEWAGGINESTYDAWLSVINAGAEAEGYAEIAAQISSMYNKVMGVEEEAETEDSEAIVSAVSSLESTAAALPGLAASAAAGALGGAQIVMDGAVVGQLILPYISAGMARANRVVQKATP